MEVQDSKKAAVANGKATKKMTVGEEKTNKNGGLRNGTKAPDHKDDGDESDSTTSSTSSSSSDDDDSSSSDSSSSEELFPRGRAPPSGGTRRKPLVDPKDDPWDKLKNGRI